MPTILCYAGYSNPFSNWFAAAAQRDEPDCCWQWDQRDEGAKDETAIAAATRNSLPPSVAAIALHPFSRDNSNSFCITAGESKSCLSCGTFMNNHSPFPSRKGIQGRRINSTHSNSF